MSWQLWQTTENASQHTYFFLHVVLTPSPPITQNHTLSLQVHTMEFICEHKMCLCPICCITEMARYAVGTIGTEQLCTQPLPEIKPYRYLCFLCDIFLVYWIYCYIESANDNLVLKYCSDYGCTLVHLLYQTFHWIKGDSTNSIVFH